MRRIAHALRWYMSRRVIFLASTDSCLAFGRRTSLAIINTTTVTHRENESYSNRGQNMEKRDIRQRRLYANHRMVVAIDRLLDAKTDSERKTASKWAHIWRDFSEDRNRDAASCQVLVLSDKPHCPALQVFPGNTG
jgi:hypothetical protein